MSFYGGSNDKTSNAAPAILPVFKASAWSGSLIKSPLEVYTPHSVKKCNGLYTKKVSTFGKTTSEDAYNFTTKFLGT